MRKPLRCSSCGELIVSPTWWDGEPYCITCAVRRRAKEHIEEVRKQKQG